MPDPVMERVGRQILADGRIDMGTTRYRGMTIVNRRTTGADVDVAPIVEVVRELGARELTATR